MRGPLRGRGGDGEGGGREGREAEGTGGDVERPGKWSAPAPALALGGPATSNNEPVTTSVDNDGQQELQVDYICCRKVQVHLLGL